MNTKLPFKLGRLTRTFDPRIPHMSSLTAAKTLAPPPPSVDYWSKLPGPLGMMLNDTLGDCTCAAFYHALQVWSFNATGTMLTAPDIDVESLYISACGYNPKVAGEGPGGNEQKVLNYLLNKGALTGTGSSVVNKLSAYVEIDRRNTDDVKRAINHCGLVYIGFNVPKNIMPENQPTPAIWSVDASNPPTIGGHAVVLPGYTQEGLNVISWGANYVMTWDFFAKYVDEVYALADQVWIEAKGTTPGGLTPAQLEAQMSALKEPWWQDLLGKI